MNALAKPNALTFDPAALLGLKLLAFVVMVLDHADFFLASGQGVHALIGRIVFPIFGVVFAYNLARMRPEKLGDVGMRLLWVGAASQFAYVYLQGAVLPLNVLFTLSLAAMAYAGFRDRLPLLVLIAFVGSIPADYSVWGTFGVAFVALAFRSGEPRRIHASIAGFVISLVLTNGTHWALLALPVIYMAGHVRLGDAPRLKQLFYIGYPLHLVILAAIKLAS